eukprot:Gb_00703 [translate_table: standard]
MTLALPPELHRVSPAFEIATCGTDGSLNPSPLHRISREIKVSSFSSGSVLGWFQKGRGKTALVPQAFSCNQGIESTERTLVDEIKVIMPGEQSDDHEREIQDSEFLEWVLKMDLVIHLLTWTGIWKMSQAEGMVLPPYNCPIHDILNLKVILCKQGSCTFFYALREIS